MHPGNFKLYRIQNDRQFAIIYLDRLISGKPCEIARSLLTIQQNVLFHERMHPEKFRVDNYFCLKLDNLTKK